MAALTRVLGIPSDHQFVAEHWRPLTRAEAMARNPFYTSRLAEDAHVYTCDRLGDDGLCQAHDDRPIVCRGYPWYDLPPRAMPLADAECGYAVDQVSAGLAAGASVVGPNDPDAPPPGKTPE